MEKYRTLQLMRTVKIVILDNLHILVVVVPVEVVHSVPVSLMELQPHVLEPTTMTENHVSGLLIIYVQV